jgi:hypothetical protein
LSQARTGTLDDAVGGVVRRTRDRSGLLRATIVVLGALVVLQSSQDVGAAKVIYLVVAAGLILGSVLAVRRAWDSPVVEMARPWLISSVVVAGLIAISLPVALARGTSPSAWLRDAAGYGLFAAAPWLATDLAVSATRRAIVGLTAIAGVLATISYAVVWLQKRHIADFPVDRLALPSAILASALFAVALGIALTHRRHRYLWLAVASATLGVLVMSGSRQTLLLLAVCPIVFVASLRADRTTPILPRLLVAAAPAVIAIGIVGATQLLPTFGAPEVAATPAVSNPPTAVGGPPAGSGGSAPPAQSAAASEGATPVPSRYLAERYGSIGSVLAGTDASLQERISQSRAVWDVFLTSPILGGGLGVLIPWTDPTGVVHTDNAFTADSPLTVLAKFGILGIGLIAVLVWATLHTIRRVGPRPATRPAWLALIGLTSAVVLLTPFAWPLEDKGSALATVLVLALALIAVRDARLRDARGGDSARVE